MDRKLIDYLPPVLREVLELKAINAANEPEIELAWDAVALLMANQFLDTADERGVSIWEKELKIFPKDTDSLEARKVRIKAMWNLELPYTLPWIRRWITSVCAPGQKVTVEDYTILLQLDYTAFEDSSRQAREILDMLLSIKPSSMRVFISSYLRLPEPVTAHAWAGGPGMRETVGAAVTAPPPMLPCGVADAGEAICPCGCHMRMAAVVGVPEPKYPSGAPVACAAAASVGMYQKLITEVSKNDPLE